MKWLTHLLSYFSRRRVAGKESIRPHPRNSPGPFYVEYGCCTACDVPMSEAPDLFAYDETNHCFVKRQPSTSEETDRMFRAVWRAELECIRYRGNDSQVLRRLAELGLPHLCDVAPPPDVQAVVRDLVTFEAATPEHAGLSALALAEAYRCYLIRLDAQRDGLDDRFRFHFMPLIGDSGTATLTYSWFEDHRHSVELRVVGNPECRWLIRHFSADQCGGRSVSQQLDDWLKRSELFSCIRWYTADQWTRSGAWQESPQ